jgi:hypothetical protein
MKRALIGFASVGILAVTARRRMHSTIAATTYPGQNFYSQAYTPQSRGSVRREGVPRTTPFSDPNSPEATGGGNLGYNRAIPRSN